jgi:SAM-dependent methyltransferase
VGVRVREQCRHDIAQRTLLFTATDYVSGEAFDVFRCDRCRLVRTSPPTDRPIASYYPSGYHAGRRYRGPLEVLPRLLAASRSRRLEKASGGPGRVLEIGCGRGTLLRELRSRGWTVMGTELNEGAARFAREANGLDVRTAPITELGLAQGSLDAVIFWHVLEHLEDPATALDEATRLLRPGGLLLVAVPRFDSPLSRWAGPAWFQLDVPRHLTHFSLDVLIAMLRERGLSPVEVRHLALEYDLFSFVQTVLNKLGLRMNLLFETLRRGEASMFGSDRSPRSGVPARILSVALAIPLTVLSLVWQPIAAARHRGDSMTALARKTAQRI